MPRLGVLLIISVLACTALSAQEAVVRRDTQFPVELKDTLKSKSAKVGDKIKFRLNEAVLIGNNIVVPEGAKITGTIDAVRNDAAEEPRSAIRIRIHGLEWKKGTARLNAVVMSVEPTPAQLMIIPHRRHPPLRSPSFTQNIQIKAHVRRDAYTDFISKDKDLVLHSGIVFMIRHIDPDREPAMIGADPIFDMSPHAGKEKPEHH
jgi:hypothetical protein